MKFTKLCLLTLSLLLISNQSYAINQGKITILNFLGFENPNVADMVQVSIEGGFTKEGCDTTLAGVLKSDTHLISALLAAYMAQKTINVSLNKDHYYFSNRCTIYTVTINP